MFFFFFGFVLWLCYGYHLCAVEVGFLIGKRGHGFIR